MEKPSEITVYIASGEGFVSGHHSYLTEVKECLKVAGCKIIDPWEQSPSIVSVVGRYLGENNVAIRKAIGQEARQTIGQINVDDIQRADVVLGILEGVEPDSGTVSEVAYGVGIGKISCGLRTDFRDSGEFDGCAVNIQLEHFILMSGGKIFRAIPDVAEIIKIVREKKERL